MVNLKFKLILNKNSGIYFPGELIQGKLEVESDAHTDKEIKELSITLNGVAKVKWQVSSGRSTRTIKDKEIYLEQKFLLISHGKKLPTGQKSFDFQCQLPLNLPASFEPVVDYKLCGLTPKGSIKYSIDVLADIPWQLDIKKSWPFTVTRVEDLNLHPELMLPIEMEKIKKFCCFFSESDPCILTVTLPRSGFVPGERLPIKIEYVNRSSVNIDITEVTLKQVLRFVCLNESLKSNDQEEKEGCCGLYKTEWYKRQLVDIAIRKNVLRETTLAGVRSRSNAEDECELLIPSDLVPTNILYSKNLQVAYELRVKAVSGCCHTNLKLHVPIIMGSVPFTNT